MLSLYRRNKLRVTQFYGDSKSQRNEALRRVQEKGGICITSYGMVLSNAEQIAQGEQAWDYVILDEGHKIKARTRTLVDLGLTL